MSKYIVNFQETSIKDIRDLDAGEVDLKFITDFEMLDVPVPLANTLRRTFSTLCPTITFDDTYYDNLDFNSINVINNTSSLHNEFIAHRLSLIPINMAGYFKKTITTKCNESGERTWKFKDDDKVPEFKIHLKNTIDQKK